jgi:hypothetical protein
MVLVDSPHVRPWTAAILRRASAFPSRTHGIDTTGIERHDRFESEVTDPVTDEVVPVAEALPLMEAQRCQWHVARITIEVRAIQPWNAIRLAMDVEQVKIGIALGEDDLQRRMEGGQRHVVADEQPAPYEGADPLDDHTELIDAGWDG